MKHAHTDVTSLLQEANTCTLHVLHVQLHAVNFLWIHYNVCTLQTALHYTTQTPYCVLCAHMNEF